MVKKESNRPNAIVATTMDRMAGKSAKVIPQNREPKTREMAQIMMLVTNVITIKASISL